MQAILAGTISAATLLGCDDTLGKIVPGYIADMVVVSGNPIEDISVLEKGILCVVKGGKIVRHEVAT
jgi:imidazolonepropionase-like amidohydrolase